MAQQSKFYKLPVSEITVNLERIIIYPPNSAVFSTPAQYGAIKTDGVIEFLHLNEYAALIQAQTEYGEFLVEVQKNAFMFGQKVTTATFIGGILCGLLEKFRCGCNDSTTPPSPSEPMDKTNPNDQEPPIDTQD
jgi:hypothetical protein